MRCATQRRDFVTMVTICLPELAQPRALVLAAVQVGEGWRIVNRRAACDG
jgi:hypothetical protein